MPRKPIAIAILCLLTAACGTFGSQEPPAVVESEAARQTAAATVEAGATPDEALARSEAVAEPK